MSNSNETQNDERKSRYFVNEKGHRIHETSNGQQWYMKPPTGSYEMGFESIFYNAILDPDFKTAVYQKMESTTEPKASLQYEGTWYNIFINQDNPDQSSISTQSTKKYSEIDYEEQEVIEKPKEKPKERQGQTGQYTKQKRDRSINEKTRLVILTEEEFQKGYKFEPFEDLSQKANPNIITIQQKDGSFIYKLVLVKITFNY